MADISKITLPNGKEYDLKDTTARNATNSAVPNTRTVNGKALSSDISLGASDVGAYTKKETDTKINAAIASAYKYKGSVTADKLPTSGQVVGDVYNITNDSSYGKAGMNVAWTGTTWDALGSNVDLSNYVTTNDSRLSNARPASDVYAWAKAASKPSYSASEIGAAPASHTHTKAQVGLGNVANLDQSKAIKSITRSGTTFTATALDGTTTTFTQQDNNTTYGLASQSSNGLMSAADKKAVDREFFRMLPKGGTVIPNGANLNSTAYLKVGNYYQSSFVDTANMTNIPIKSAFIMYVLSPVSEVYDNESTAPWVYRLRIFVEYTGSSIFTQNVYSWNTAGSFSYSPWVKMTNSNDLGAVSKLINDHIANKSNPHGVTKAQVGLGNVDNTADSAKSVKYATSAGNAGSADTVNGHTINADVPAGAKFTDTTYSAATQSANGLMSAADKKAIDREFFRMLPKGGTHIPPNADLNTVQYIKIGNYYNSAIAETQTMKNCPGGAFIMYVLSPLSEAYDDESTQTQVYRLRIFVEYTGNSIFTQMVYSGTTTGSFTYGPWVKMTNSNDLGAVSNTINTHIANKSNPHGVTKAQVGLSNVDNVSKSSILQSVYPAGAIYMSMSSTSPASLFGGTWEQIKDTFLLGAGDSYTAGSTGGEATHTLTVNEMPSHSHEVKAQSAVKDSKYGKFSHNINGGSSISIYSMEQTHETGGGQAHNNMPPYLTVYMWKRIA